jgi:hypothetical protein
MAHELHCADVAPDPQSAGRFELSAATVHILLSALARLKASEQGNLRLGPGSTKLIQQVERAEAELRRQLPERAK